MSEVSVNAICDDDFLREKLAIIAKAFREIQERDRRWKEPNPTDKGYTLKIIEAGSTGVHDGFMDDFGYWVHSGETYPSWPLLVMRVD